MDYVVLVLAGLGLSVCLNIYFLLRHLKKRPLTTDAKALLHEIMSGKAVVEIKVMDAAGLFYRSPR